MIKRRPNCCTRIIGSVSKLKLQIYLRAENKFSVQFTNWHAIGWKKKSQGKSQKKKKIIKNSSQNLLSMSMHAPTKRRPETLFNLFIFLISYVLPPPHRLMTPILPLRFNIIIKKMSRRSKKNTRTLN
jgi:hypothetical protein